jgi:hypothetical protein
VRVRIESLVYVPLDHQNGVALLSPFASPPIARCDTSPGNLPSPVRNRCGLTAFPDHLTNTLGSALAALRDQPISVVITERDLALGDWKDLFTALQAVAAPSASHRRIPTRG